MADRTPAKKAAKKSAAAPATRKQRTPRERAQDDLDIEVRKVEALVTRRDRLKAELGPVEEELESAVRRRDFLAGHPDLQGPPDSEVKDA
jgi:hypothetical protein